MSSAAIVPQIALGPYHIWYDPYDICSSITWVTYPDPTPGFSFSISRRKRADRSDAETPGEQIVRKLTNERIEELQKIIAEERQKYKWVGSCLCIISDTHLVKFSGFRY